jgi:hypothetical protein
MSRTALVSLLLLSATTTASADRRLFTSTYEYKTMPAGATAVELWHTQSRTTWDDGDPGSATALENILEIEHGLTDHWDAALYMVFTQLASHDAMLPSQPYAFHELKLETRYRFADRGELPVDILAYAEVAKEFGEGVYEVEGKGIFARDFDRFTAAFNAIAEVEFGPDVPETELELGWAAGISYEVHPKLNIGVETYGALEFEDETEVLATVGPAIAVAPSSNLWFALTTGVGLDEAPKFTSRLILGIEL